MPVKIRPATASDAEALTALALAGKMHWGYPESWLEAWRGLLTITPEYVAANLVCCAEDEAGQVVGFYALERDGGRFLLESLFLATSLIGHGSGRQLFEHAVQAARALGADEFLIDADPHAEGFYLRMGAKRIGETVSRLTGTERIVPRLRYDLAEREKAPVLNHPGGVEARTPRMIIVTLAARPDLVAILGEWHFAEWAELYHGWTLEQCQAELKSHNDPERIPTTLVALDEGGEPAGSVSLLLDDLPGYQRFSPWLGSLFVRPERRSAGVGGMLVAAAVAEARRLGVERLYLFTPAHAGYYAARGWSEVEQASANGEPVTLMTRRTDA